MVGEVLPQILPVSRQLLRREGSGVALID